MPAPDPARSTTTTRDAASCDSPPQKEAPGKSHGSAGNPERNLAGGPAMNGTDRDAHRMQAAGGDNEAQAVEQRALSRRQLLAVCVSVEDGEEADQRGGGDKRRPTLRH